MSDWEILQSKLKERFGNEMEFDAILFMIGLNELDASYKKYKKDQKMDIMHIAICTLLEPYGFYKFTGKDEDGWPHWDLVESLPHLDSKQQNKLMVEAMIDYFRKGGFI